MMIFSLVVMIGLDKCCITSACLQWLCHSGERIVARGPLVELSALDLVPYSKPCPGHNAKTVWNIFMKLYSCMRDIETMCHEQGRQLLLVWFLNYLPLT